MPFCKMNYFQVLHCSLDCYPQVYCSFSILHGEAQVELSIGMWLEWLEA